MKVPAKRDLAYRFLTPGCTVLVTSAWEKKVDILTVSWQTPVSKDPPLLAVSVAKGHYSHGLIQKGGAFVINVPTEDILAEVMYCGTRSGRDVDKFSETKLTPEPGERVEIPHIQECVAYVECKTVQAVDAGDHTLFIGEVLKSEVTRGIFDGVWKIGETGTEFLMHLGGPDFFLPGKKIRFKKGKKD
jgi:flavin reductase (DIM6/NTAB) family NADH-FMN oxidoreductase RutF